MPIFPKICPRSNPQCNFKIEAYHKILEKQQVRSLIANQFADMKHLHSFWFDQLSKHTIFTLKNDHNQLVGLVDIRPQSSDSMLNFLIVDSSLQHQHIGSQLLRFAEQYAKENWQSQSMRLHTNLYNLRNLQFYFHEQYTPQSINPTGYITAPAVEFVKKI